MNEPPECTATGPASFIVKLRSLVDDASFADAVTWTEDGTAIVIQDVDVFARRVLGSENNVFKTKNYSSFVRQLNMYGFSKANGYRHFGRRHPNVFRHQYFLRDQPDLAWKIRRMPQRQRPLLVSGKASAISGQERPPLPATVSSTSGPSASEPGSAYLEREPSYPPPYRYPPMGPPGYSPEEAPPGHGHPYIVLPYQMPPPPPGHMPSGSAQGYYPPFRPPPSAGALGPDSSPQMHSASRYSSELGPRPPSRVSDAAVRPLSPALGPKQPPHSPAQPAGPSQSATEGADADRRAGLRVAKSEQALDAALNTAGSVLPPPRRDTHEDSRGWPYPPPEEYEQQQQQQYGRPPLPAYAYPQGPIPVYPPGRSGPYQQPYYGPPYPGQGYYPPPYGPQHAYHHPAYGPAAPYGGPQHPQQYPPPPHAHDYYAGPPGGGGAPPPPRRGSLTYPLGAAAPAPPYPPGSRGPRALRYSGDTADDPDMREQQSSTSPTARRTHTSALSHHTHQTDTDAEAALTPAGPQQEIEDDALRQGGPSAGSATSGPGADPQQGEREHEGRTGSSASQGRQEEGIWRAF